MKRILCLKIAFFLMFPYLGRESHAEGTVKIRPKRLPGLTASQVLSQTPAHAIHDSGLTGKFRDTFRDSNDFPVKFPLPPDLGRTPSYTKSARAVKMKNSARDYLTESQIEANGFGLYAYVIFTRKCGSQRECETYRAIYRNYIQLLHPVEKELQTDPDSVTYAVMYWMLDLQPKAHGPGIPIPEEEEEEDSASWFVKHYDYARASVVAGRANLPRKGPYLFASTKPLVKDLDSSTYLFSVNLDRTDSAGILGKFEFFQQALLDHPSNWKSETKWMGFKDDLVTRINAASESVFKAFKVLCGKSELHDCCSKYFAFGKLDFKLGAKPDK